MAGTRRDLNKSQCPQLTTHGRLIKRDAKLFEYPLGKVLPTPAHHTVDCRDRTVLNNPRKRPAVFVIELGRLAPKSRPALKAGGSVPHPSNPWQIAAKWIHQNHLAKQQLFP